ncbi:MAG: acyltransferase [Cytophagia bacterium]|nr:acyltransferase [Cytophagia bacterium]
MEDIQPKKGIYFPSLNGIRIISCYIVVVFHINQLKGVFGYEKLNLSVLGPGNIHLTMFFVMSGFLITYLLIAEKKLKNSINLRKFYIRRILRIWPLYFVMLILGFFILPQYGIFQFPDNNINDYSSFWEMFIAFCLFFPHLHGITYDVNITLSPLWSIGVEEQFYLIWPFIVAYVKRPMKTLLLIVPIFFALRFIDIIISFTGLVVNDHAMDYLHWLSAYFYKFRLGSMAIGGVLAILYINQNMRILKILYHPAAQISAWTFLFCLQAFPSIRPDIFDHEVYSSLFAVIMINLATNPKTLLSFDKPWLRNFGELAYSSYVFHIPLIMVCIYVLGSVFHLDLNSLTGNLLLFLSSMLATYCISYLSYHYFELWFLKLKSKFSIIRTRTH